MNRQQWHPRPPVHWQHPQRPAPTATCHGRKTTAPVTTERAEVTCGTCRQSHTWREAT